MNNIDPKDACFLAAGLALDLKGIWSEDIHFTKQSLLPYFTNRMLYDLLNKSSSGTI